MIDNILKENEKFWPEWDRELLVIFNKKAPTKIDSPYLTKSLKSTRENLSSMKEKPIFITDLLTYQSYYTFRWVIDNGYRSFSFTRITQNPLLFRKFFEEFR